MGVAGDKNGVVKTEKREWSEVAKKLYSIAAIPFPINICKIL